LRIVYFDSAIAVGLEEDLNVVVQTDVEAQWDVNDVDVPWITIVVAVSNTERELAAAQS
jgi:hypothetical protein